jgi:hypothetical protein
MLHDAGYRPVPPYVFCFDAGVGGGLEGGLEADNGRRREGCTTSGWSHIRDLLYVDNKQNTRLAVEETGEGGCVGNAAALWYPARMRCILQAREGGWFPVWPI